MKPPEHPILFGSARDAEIARRWQMFRYIAGGLLVGASVMMVLLVLTGCTMITVQAGWGNQHDKSDGMLVVRPEIDKSSTQHEPNAKTKEPTP